MQSLKNLGLLVASLAAAFLAVELGLRVFPNQFERQFRADRLQELHLRYNPRPDGLYTLIPNTVVQHHGACYTVDGIQTNAQGFRDKPWMKEAGAQRVALLGDSIIEGLQVERPRLMAAVLSQRMGIDVLNAGISGYSTVTELMAYQQLVRPFKPELVILVVYPGNDIEGNFCSFQRGAKIPCAKLGKGGELDVILPTPVQSITDRAPSTSMIRQLLDYPYLSVISGLLRRNLVTYQLAYRLKLLARAFFSQGEHSAPTRWKKYLEPVDSTWEEAWRTTHLLLSALKREVEKDGAKLVIVGVPEHLVFSPEWRRELLLGTGYRAPEDFNPLLPMQRLQEIAREVGLPMLDVTSDLLAYRDRHRLSYPYFSFSCDGHFNPLGHALVGHAVADWLERETLVKRPIGRQRPDGLKSAFEQQPQAIIGEESYRSIYQGGVYESRTDDGDMKQ